MKICHIVDLKNVGGVETLFSKFLSLDFGALDIEHTVIFNSVIHPFFEEDVLSNASDVMSIKFGKRLKVRTAWLKARRVRSFYRMTKPDVVIFWNNFPSVYTRFIPPLAKVIYYEHGNCAFDHDIDSASRFFRYVTEVVTVSRDIGEMLDDKFSTEHLAKRVIYNFIDDRYIDKTPVISKLTSGFSLGMAGRVVPVKGMAIAVKAVAMLKHRGVNAALDIAGEGEEQQQLHELAVREGVADRLTFHPGRRDLREFYANLDLLLVPSITEAASLVVAESLACGTPVLASRTGGIPEVGKEGEGTTLIEPTLPLAEYTQWCSSCVGLPTCTIAAGSRAMAPTQVLDPAHVADAIQRILGDQQAYAEQAILGARYAKEQFSRKRYIARFQKLLAGMM